MIWQGYALYWMVIGYASFWYTQNKIDGWDDIRSKPWPQPLFIIISAHLMGLITTAFCIYTLYCYHKNKKQNGTL